MKFLKTGPLCLIIVLFAAALVQAQQLRRTGLIKEDLSKVSWIKEYKVLAKTGSLPVRVDLTQFMPPVGDQGAQGSCVAWAAGYYIKTYQEYMERGWDINDPAHQASPAFLYNMINHGVDSGAQFSNAAWVLTRYGCARKSLMPYDQYNYTAFPSASAMESAMHFRSSAAYYINSGTNSGILALKQLLNDRKIAMIGINVWGNFDDIQSSDFVYCVKSKKGQDRGGHAVTIIGYDDSLQTLDGPGAFKIVNSWGKYWGKQGFGWISYKAMMDAELTQRMVLFVTDKHDYSPSLVARVKVTNFYRGKTEFQFGMKTGSLQETISFTTLASSYLNMKFPDQILTFDISDLADAVVPGTFSTIFLKCADLSYDGKAGTLESYSVEVIPMDTVLTAAGLPKAIGDASYARVELSLIPTEGPGQVFLQFPVNGADGVQLTTPLYWKQKASASGYKVEVSLNDKFEAGSIVFKADNILSTQVSVDGLQRNCYYYWRVAAAGTEAWSDVWSFKTTSVNTAGGYTAAAGKYEWVDITSAGTKITAWENLNRNGAVVTSLQNKAVLDDGYSSMAVPIGFDFEFFGRKFSQVYVGINGLASFTEKVLNTAKFGGFTGAPNYLGAYNQDFFSPNGDYFENTIAAAYSDLDLNPNDGYGHGNVFYHSDGSRFVLSWEKVGSFEAPNDTLNSFQIILNKADNTVLLQYKNIGRQGTISALKTLLQESDTLSYLWVANGVPSNHLISNQTALLFTPLNTTDLNDKKDVQPVSFTLGQNYPNPFNPSTRISYSIEKEGYVELAVYNMLGQKVASLFEGYRPAGEYSEAFDASHLSSGIYIYRLSSSGQVLTKKMSFIK